MVDVPLPDHAEPDELRRAATAGDRERDRRLRIDLLEALDDLDESTRSWRGRSCSVISPH